VASFVSPYIEGREFVKRICSNFIEIYTKSSLEICRRRYSDALSVQDSKVFPEEIYSLYENPIEDYVLLDTERKTIAQCKEEVLNYIRKTSKIRDLRKVL